MQNIAVVLMRIMLGWTMLWAFFDKLLGLGFSTPHGYGYLDGGSPSPFVTYMTSGVFASLFKSLAGNALVDVMLLLGCLILGVTLIFGFASKLTTVLMVVFLILMLMITVPPKDNPLLDYHIVYMVCRQ